MSTNQQTYPTCQNPFFPCKNTEPQLKIIVDIQFKNEKYSICNHCWPTIADSEEYTWSTQKPQETENQPLEADWSSVKEETEN